MNRQQAIQVFAVAAFIGLLAGLGAFVIVFLGFGGYEFITKIGPIRRVTKECIPGRPGSDNRHQRQR